MPKQQVRAGELRLNNILRLTKGDRPVVITSIHEKYHFGRYIVATGTFRIENHELQGIPLTEELLVKAGFEDYCIQVGDFALLCVTLPETAEMRQYVSVADHDLKIKVKYLHQLQNLYFCLTGRELTIEL